MKKICYFDDGISFYFGGVMQSVERRMKIFEILKEKKVIQVVDLASEFHVSNMTIRRDLAKLEEQGVLTTHYGGATLNEGVSSEPSFQLKSGQSQKCKEMIAKEASFLVNDGDSIFVDCGTTTMELVKYLQSKKITIVTNSWRVLSEIKDFSKIKVIMAPGEYDVISEGVLSSSTISFIQQYRVDKAFISTQGVDEHFDVCVPMDYDAQVKRSIMNCAKHAILLVDHTKFNQSYFAKHGNLKDFDVVITDCGMDDAMFNQIKNCGISIIKANRE